MALFGVAFGAVLSGAGCDRSAPPRGNAPAEAPAPSAVEVARALGLDASDLTAPVDPPAPAGDLKREIAGFSTLDACVKSHAQADPLVGDALRAIGYETFLHDACRVLEAMKGANAAACKTIDAQGLRAQCEAYVAMAAGAPDDCPFEVEGEPTRGRDARCVAVASRDARLCAGLRDGRAACEALVARDEKRCARDAACARDVVRWRNVLPAPERDGPAMVTRARLEIRGAEGSPEPARTETDLSPDFGRGVVVVLDFEGAHVELGTPHELGTTMFAPSPVTRARAALRALQGDRGARIEHAEIAVPGSAVLVVPGARFDGAVTIGKLEPRRAGEVAIALEGTIGVAPRAYKVRLDATTFVRDVVRAPTAAVGKRSK